ncbi:hypothetical protein ACLKA7_005053 [Drosophila subpalustris]
MLKTSLGEVLVAAAYLPPRLYWNQQDFNALLHQLGQRFIVRGNFNAKHRLWGNYKADTRGLAQVLTTGRPTFFPYNRLNVPSCLDFFIYKEMPDNLLLIPEEYYLSSDHLPLLASISSLVSLSNEATEFCLRERILVSLDRFWTRQSASTRPYLLLMMSIMQSRFWLIKSG